jgi:hypothetical protein
MTETDFRQSLSTKSDAEKDDILLASFRRCVATIEAMGHHGAPLDDLPALARSLRADYERARTTMSSIHRQAAAFAEENHLLRHELNALWGLVTTLSEVADPVRRANAANALLSLRADLTPTRSEPPVAHS